jgi:GntR family transcriptional regulator
VPLYYQIEVALRRAIESGQFLDGRLPTEEELAQRYEVSRITIRSALRRLEEDGLIERHRGQGTFVCPDALAKIVRYPSHLLGFEEDLRRQGGTPETEVLSIEEGEGSAAIAEALGVPPSERVYCVRRLGRLNGAPLWLERRYYPHDIGAKMIERDLAWPSATHLVQDVLGVPIASARLRLEAIVANSQQARYLEVQKGYPLLVYQVTFHDVNGRALEVVRAAFRGDRYAVVLDVPSDPASDLNAVWGERDWRGAVLGPVRWEPIRV